MRSLTFYLLLLALVLAGDRLGGRFCQQLADHSQFRYARLYNGQAAADILLVGNSRGLTFYQPFIEQATGLRTFNLSYNGLPADLANVLVQDYLDRYPAPRVLVLEVTTADRPNRELIASFLPYASHSARLDALIRQNNTDAWWGGQVSSLFRANNEVFQRALYYRNRPDTDWLIDRQIAPALAATAPLDTFPISVQRPLIAQLANAVAYARSKGVRVELVISPYYPQMVRDWTNVGAVSQATQQATGLPVRDYRQALPDPADFGDFMHPNKRGAQHYIDLLVRDGVFK